MDIADDVYTKVQAMPAEQAREVLNFVNFLQEKSSQMLSNFTEVNEDREINKRLDQTEFFLDDEQYQRFVDILEQPVPADIAKKRQKLMDVELVWEA